MGLPELYFSYSVAAQTAIARAKQGIVALLLQDTRVTAGVYTVSHEADIPAELGADNANYVKRALVGSTNRPQKLYLSVVGAEGTVEDALGQLTPRTYDYVAGFPDSDSTDAKALADGVIARRKKNYIGKAVVPSYAANDVGVINFVATNIAASAGTFGGVTLPADTYTTAEYCSRIAGLLAGTPGEGSATGAALDEVSAITEMDDDDLDDAIDAGQLALYHDGRKVRVARAVNSYAPSGDLTTILRKIKAIEVIDLIHYYAVTTADDEYRGQCANTYDNKCLLVAALQDYLTSLEPDLLESGTGAAEIDLEATRAWLKEQGTDVTDMSDDEIRKADTGSYVFIKLTGRIVDAMEDFSISLALLNH